MYVSSLYAAGEKRRAGYWWAAAIVGALASALFIAHSRHSAAMQREALASFGATLDLGMRRDDVTRRCERACLDHAGWEYSPDVKSLGGPFSIVASPLTFGAKNWVVFIAFDNDVVAAVLVRTADTRRLHPEGAPKDRIDVNYAAHAPGLAEFSGD